MSDRDRGTVIEMIEYVINNLARKQEKVREEVAKTMGGIVLTTRIDRWIAEGEAKERENIVLSAYKNGHSAEQISEFTSIPLDEVKRIISK